MGSTLKDMEAYILGVIGQSQPCTPYRAMKFFLESPSVYYSGSAGAIYPAIKRMEERGLLKSVPSGSEGKQSKLYSLTPKGKKMFTHWFENPELIADGGFDPLRGRVSLIAVFEEKDLPRQLQNLYNAAKERLDHMDEIASHYDKDHSFKLSIELERETLRAKVKFLEKELKKKSKKK